MAYQIQTWADDAVGQTPIEAARLNHIETGVADAHSLILTLSPLGHTHPASEISDSTSIGRSVLTALTQADARTAIGAGTSSLVIGTTAGTAKSGDYAPPTASELEAGLVELATAAETITGTDTTRAVHPAGVKAVADTKAAAVIAANLQTGTAYTLVAADAGKAVEMDNAAANTLTVPASVFTAGQVVEIFQAGAGQTTVAAGAGLTLRAPDGAKLAKQYASATLRFRSATEAVLAGNVIV